MQLEADTERLEWLDESIKLWVGDAMCGDEKVDVLEAQLKGTCGLYKKHLAQIWCVAYLTQDARQRWRRRISEKESVRYKMP